MRQNVGSDWSRESLGDVSRQLARVILNEAHGRTLSAALADRHGTTVKRVHGVPLLLGLFAGGVYLSQAAMSQFFRC